MANTLASASSSSCFGSRPSGLNALPAISSGIFGFPKDRCAEIMLDATLAFFAAQGVKLHFTRDAEGVRNVDDLLERIASGEPGSGKPLASLLDGP